MQKRLLTAALAILAFQVSAQDSIKVYAASSMTNVVNELISEFEKNHDIDVTPVYASTSSLVRQIERGAPADVFIAANEKWMTHLVDRGYVLSDNVTNWAGNELVLISSESDKTDYSQFRLDDATTWQATLQDERLAVGNTMSVPAGIYAKESLEALEVWQSVRTRLAPSNNVRMALALVERQEAILGIVYKTDAMLSTDVSIVDTFPESSHTPIRYPVAKLNGNESTQAFYTFMQGEFSKSVLERYGFNTH
ncbi:molybdate ABC transporter substrate-binding protein [Vibrio fortis]|uniref:molybdate ABC transporter substrate-binding protein n=1 Tax=Vibrio fortis TaxID=212667 RepID=UPI002F3E72FB